jgi:hypothetical protein
MWAPEFNHQTLGSKVGTRVNNKILGANHPLRAIMETLPKKTYLEVSKNYEMMHIHSFLLE